MRSNSSKIIVAIFLFTAAFFLQSSFAQTCGDTSLRKQYYIPADTLKAANQITAADNSTIVTGKYTPKGSSRTDGFAMRISSNGILQWSKKYSTSNYNERLILKSSLELDNGDIIILGRTTDLTDAPQNNIVILKTNATGTLIWKEVYQINPAIDPSARIQATSVKQGLNGDLLIVGTTGNYNFFLKVNAAGGLLISKLFAGNDGSAETFIDVFPDNNSVVIFGIDNSGTCSSDPRALYTLRLNYNSGSVDEIKHFCFTSPGSYAAYVVVPYSYHVKKIENKFIVSGAMLETSNRDFMIARFDSSLNFIDAKIINKPFATNFNQINISANAEITFVVTTNNNQNFYYNTIDKNWRIIRQRRLQIPSNGFGNILAEGGQRIDFKNNASTFLINYPAINNSVVELMQLNNNDESGTACFGIDTSFSSIVNFSLYTSPYSITKVIDNVFLSNSIAITETALPVLENNLCKQISLCSSIKIFGQDTLCNTDQSVSYAARTNGGCSKRVNWKLDTTSYRYMTYLNDSTINILFKNPVSTKLFTLYAEAGTCGNIADSFKITLIPAPQVLPNDTVLCKGDSLRLSVGRWLKSYRWQDGSTDSILIVRSPGTYWVKVQSYCGENFADTVEIKAPLNKLTLGPDVFKCNNDTVTLRATSGFTNYTWLPKSNRIIVSDSIVKVFPSAKTDYYVSAQTSESCVMQDTISIEVFYSPAVNLGKDQNLCKGDSLILDAGLGFQKYYWNTGDTTSKITITNTGIYFVYATTQQGCKTSDTLSVTAIMFFSSKFLPDDTTMCPNGVIKISSLQNYKEYLWSNNVTTQSVSISMPGIYWLQVKDTNNCVSKEFITINQKQCTESFFMPTAFTPNADGRNDFFKPTITGNIQHYLFIIFNRWGQKVFETSDFNRGWDGTLKGKQQQTDCFIWACSYQFVGTPLKLEKGSVLLIR